MRNITRGKSTIIVRENIVRNELIMTFCKLNCRVCNMHHMGQHLKRCFPATWTKRYARIEKLKYTFEGLEHVSTKTDLKKSK